MVTHTCKKIQEFFFVVLQKCVCDHQLAVRVYFEQLVFETFGLFFVCRPRKTALLSMHIILLSTSTLNISAAANFLPTFAAASLMI